MTPDAPLMPRRNAVWCASFLAGWQEMKKVGGGDMQIEGAEALCTKLNARPDVTPLLPPDGFYAASGIYSDQWARQVREEVAAKVTHSAIPEFPGAVPGQPISYSCLYSRLKFPKPYVDWDEKMSFRGTPVRAFGIDHKHKVAYSELRQQTELLFIPDEFPEMRPGWDFALDLDRTSTPNQLIVARLTPGASLQETWESLLQKMDHFATSGHYRHSGAFGAVGVPEINFDLWYMFPEISRCHQLSKGPGSGLFREFRQNIRFKLDRSGAELWSQTSNPTTIGASPSFVLNAPFLLVMKRRDARQPYLMFWIETPELLRR